jgi:hypothetical protein
MRLARQPVPELIPCTAYAGPKAHVHNDRAMALALARINETFAGADILALTQLPDGRWMAVTTH